MTNLIALAEKVERLGDFGDNALDVQVEVALFRPNELWVSVRPNAAGTKVIYADDAGAEVTFWADEWTHKAIRSKTVAKLRAHAAQKEG